MTHALDAYGRCPSCGEDYLAYPGIYHCDNCEPCAKCGNEDCAGDCEDDQ